MRCSFSPIMLSSLTPNPGAIQILNMPLAASRAPITALGGSTVLRRKETHPFLVKVSGLGYFAALLLHNPFQLSHMHVACLEHAYGRQQLHHHRLHIAGHSTQADSFLQVRQHEVQIVWIPLVPEDVRNRMDELQK